MMRQPGQRDVRLDLFRGLAMFVIFVSHMPDNSWFLFIPARFGFSSAGELFVFCSGLASAYAFGRSFERQGFRTGLVRVIRRIGEVYRAHILLALVMIGISLLAARLTGIDYAARLGLGWFLAHPVEGALRLFGLSFMPAYLDILPMYLVLLAMLPAMAMLGRVSPRLPLLAMAVMWLVVQLTGVNLPGGPVPGGDWFFNPFAWQAIFYTGFAFGMGWLRAPVLRRGGLFWLCVGFLVLSVPLNFWAFTETVPQLAALHDWLVPAGGKTNLVAPLYLHFLASAYVALVLVEPMRGQLHRLRPVVLVGQQALSTFMAGIVLAWMGGMVLDAVGRSLLSTATVNLAGFAGLIGVAWLTREAKRRQAAPRAGVVSVQPAE